MSLSLAPPRPCSRTASCPRSPGRRTLALVIGGAALTAALAQVAIPLWPVPITGQTLAVLLVGSVARRDPRRPLDGALRPRRRARRPGLLGPRGGTARSSAPPAATSSASCSPAALTGWLAQRRWERAAGARHARVRRRLGRRVPASACPGSRSRSASTWAQTLAGGLAPFIIGGVSRPRSPRSCCAAPGRSSTAPTPRSAADHATLLERVGAHRAPARSVSSEHGPVGLLPRTRGPRSCATPPPGTPIASTARRRARRRSGCAAGARTRRRGRTAARR